MKKLSDSKHKEYPGKEMAIEDPAVRAARTAVLAMSEPETKEGNE